MNYKIKINGAEHEVHIRKVEGNKAHLTVNKENFEVEVEGLVVTPTQISVNTTPKPIQRPLPTDIKVVKPVKSKFDCEVKPPLPGVILELCVEEGTQVKKGQVLYVLEAMKMENHIESDYEGTVDKIYRTKGESVMESDTILVIK